MTSLHGTFEYFDYDAWQRQRCLPKTASSLQYPDGTLMAFLQKNHPRLAQIIIMAKYDRRFADPQGRFTLFVSPDWEQYSAAEIERIPINDAKRIVASITLPGRFRRIDLLTSQDSQLVTIDPSYALHLWLDRRDQLLKMNDQPIIAEKILSNGIIHLLSLKI